MSSDFQISQAYQPVAAIGVDARANFINRTYNHLMGAIVLFTLIEVGSVSIRIRGIDCAGAPWGLVAARSGCLHAGQLVRVPDFAQLRVQRGPVRRARWFRGRRVDHLRAHALVGQLSTPPVRFRAPPSLRWSDLLDSPRWPS